MYCVTAMMSREPVRKNDACNHDLETPRSRTTSKSEPVINPSHPFRAITSCLISQDRTTDMVMTMSFADKRRFFNARS